ncbi:atp-dependent rna helicase deah13 [Nicotiana attenuata]|uniref:RNA helicase n=1 Tax=Nicotiana attenuata TaxID=49451 RepID=A0A314L8B7_NICAT|nr:atp-dependent rna helicase deah13 [Nicotiana attenuata]
MTDGILLRELQNDFLLRRYSILILDEAHERSLNTDILIGMLSRIVRERQREYEEQQKKVLSGQTVSPEERVYPLKLVLMSATLRVEDFISGQKNLRDPPPVMEVPTRLYPVTVHFSKRTEMVDYVGKTYKKILSIHKRLPPGDVFGSEGNTIEENVIKEISEAFDDERSSMTEITERFNSYDEDHGEIYECESEISYDSADDSDLDVYGDDAQLLNQKSLSSDGKLNVLGEEGSLTSLKAAFEALAGKRTSQPASILKPEASGLKRAGNLLNKMRTKKRTIDSCAMLRKLWDDNPRELFSEILDWFQQGFHDHFEDLWAKMQLEVFLDPKEWLSKKVKREKRNP